MKRAQLMCGVSPQKGGNDNEDLHSIKNKDKVQEVFGGLKTKGYEVTTDWTLTDDIPEDERGLKRDYMRSIAKRDFEGIRECDVFILLSKPSEGRSMYVELGLAIAKHEATGKPSVFVVGPDNNESVFYFHPSVQSVGSLDEALERTMRTKIDENNKKCKILSQLKKEIPLSKNKSKKKQAL